MTTPTQSIETHDQPDGPTVPEVGSSRSPAPPARLKCPGCGYDLRSAQRPESGRVVCSECGRVASIDLARKTALPFDERVSRLAPWQFLLPSVVVLGLLAATLLAITAGSIALQVAPSLSVLLWSVWGIVLFGSFGAVAFSLIVAMTSIVPNPVRARRSAERAVVAMELLLANGAAIFTLSVFASGVAVILSVLFDG